MTWIFWFSPEFPPNFASEALHYPLNMILLRNVCNCAAAFTLALLHTKFTPTRFNAINSCKVQKGNSRALSRFWHGRNQVPNCSDAIRFYLPGDDSSPPLYFKKKSKFSICLSKIHNDCIYSSKLKKNHRFTHNLLSFLLELILNVLSSYFILS